MPLPKSENFSFVVDGFSPKTLYVLRFAGDEGLSRLFEYQIDVVSEQADLDLENMLHKPAALTVHGKNGDSSIQGIVARVEQRHGFHGYYFYQVTLAPKLWQLTRVHQNQIFLDQTLPQIIESLLQEGGLNADDYELRLMKDYPSWEYICQYRENHFQFLSYYLEKYGLYYFFDHTVKGGKLIITDTKLSHQPAPEAATVDFSPPSGLEPDYGLEIFYTFFCQQQLGLKNITLKDYYFEKPSLDLTSRSEVNAKGQGEIYLYGEHFRTQEEGRDLADIRAEEQRCREKVFIGQGNVPYARPGYTFQLQDHFRSDYNQDYLVTDVLPEGDQSNFFSGFGLESVMPPTTTKPYFRSQVTAVGKNIQFRPPRRTPKSRFYGTLHATVDGSQSAQYAELDSQGRYKVILPFDLSGRKDGKASTWLRMIQPYTGSNHGQHFPLHKGTEVLLTFIDGDPNRPMIAGAAPNPDNPSVVTSDNSTQSRLTTSGGNKIHIEDQEGSQRILFQTPTANSWFRMGSPNDPPAASDSGHDIDDVDVDEMTTVEGFKIYSHDSLDVEVKTYNELVLGERSEIVFGAESEMTFGLYFELIPVFKIAIGGLKWSYDTMDTEIKTLKNEIHELRTNITSIQNRMIGVGNNIRGISNELDTERNRITALDTRITAEETNLQATNQTITTNKTAIEASVERVQASATKTITSEIKAVTSKIDSIALDVKAIDSKVETIDSKIYTAELEVAVVDSLTIT